MKWLNFILLSILLIFSSYNKGFYYSTDLYQASLLINTLFLLWLIWKAWQKKLHSVKIVFPILILPMIYLIPAFSADNPQGAWDSYVRWVFYSSFFILLYEAAGNNRIKAFFPMVLQITGLFIGLIPLLHFHGLIEFKSAIVASRFAGAFQYPNTFGMIMGAISLFSLIMLSKEKNSVVDKLIYSVPVITLMLGLIQSNSRAMFLIFPLAWFTGLALMKFRNQLAFITFTIVSIMLSFLVIVSMNLFAFIASTLLFVFSVIVYDRIQNNLFLRNRLEAVKFNKWILPIIVMVISLLGVLDLKEQGLVYKLLPAQLQERISSISLSSATAQERLIFFGDAIEISKDYPLMGAGGEAWVSIYKKYQSLPYFSNKVHNGFLEWLIDTGFIGFSFLILSIGYFGRLLIMEYKLHAENTLHTAVLISLLTILVHSFLDFNLSYGTVWMIVIWLIVTGLKQPQVIEQTSLQKHRIIYWGIGSLVAILIITAEVSAFNFWQADKLYKLSIQSNSLTMKEAFLKSAIADNPYNKNYLIKLGELYENQAKQGKSKELENIAELITTLEPNNSAVYLKAGDFSKRAGNDFKAMEYYSQGLELDRYHKILYEKSIKGKVHLAIDLLEKGQINEAKVFLVSASSDYKVNRKWQTYFLEHAPAEQSRFNSRDFKITGETSYNAALAYFLLEEFDEVISIYDWDTEQHFTEYGNIAALAALSYDRLGDPLKAEELVNKNEHAYPEIRENINYFRTAYSFK